MLSRRLVLYLAGVFLVSWPAWWALSVIVPPGGKVLGDPVNSLLYSIGGLGPPAAALIAVALSPASGAFREYLGRLARWRAAPVWYLTALLTPPTVAWCTEHLVIWAGPAGAPVAPLAPLSRIVSLFPVMILGGGLEELGWRGVVQPELERRLPRLTATFGVATLWALWHSPLFFIPGVSQYGENFWLFALDLFGTAFMLAGLYGATGSILLCVLFHAAINTTMAMGLVSPPVAWPLALMAGLARLVIGVALALGLGAIKRRPEPKKALP